MTQFEWQDLCLHLENGQRAEFTRVTGSVTVSKIVGLDGTGTPYMELEFSTGEVLVISPEGVTLRDAPRASPSPRSDALREHMKKHGIEVMEMPRATECGPLDLVGYMVPTVVLDEVDPMTMEEYDEAYRKVAQSYDNETEEK